MVGQNRLANADELCARMHAVVLERVPRRRFSGFHTMYLIKRKMFSLDLVLLKGFLL